MFDSVTDAVEGAVSQFGVTFFLAGVMPMLVGVVVNQYVYFPPAWNLFPEITDPLLDIFTGPMLTTVALSFALAIVIIPLNPFIIKLFEGLLPGLPVLLRPALARQRRRYRRHLYDRIDERRAVRRALLTRYEMTGEYDEDDDLALQEQLQELHAQQERGEPVQTMPYDASRLTPTRFGNAWAVMEEYPMARYGMDGMFYWPYMRAVLLNENPGLLGQVDGQKLLIDISMHMAFVTGILAVEGAVLSVLNYRPAVLIAAAVSLILYVLFYTAGVQYTRTMARLITESFDLYRWRLLDQFGVARPDDLDDEYWVWMRLSAFLRRGEPFYFDMLPRNDEDSTALPDDE